MPEINKLIADQALVTLRNTIQEAKGNEVFFLANTDDRGIIQEITPLARGNDTAVPALMQVASQGDVILHNHPSGHLTPSQADVGVASEFGNKGVGFYIVNNLVDEVYVVVEAFRREKLVPLSIGQLLDLIAPQGAIASKLGGYESRPEQRRMTEAVGAAFNHSKLALIEAGTGTGKSLAYLVPAILWSVQNKQRVVVSTNTINLQEQLINKDLPFLKSALSSAFKAVLIKGRSNYVCLGKIDSLEKEGDHLIDSEERAELKALIQWAHNTSDGSRSDLSVLPSPPVWEKVACESDNCGRIRCSFYTQCFFYKARREASSADVLVVNHHLLFSDLAVRSDTGRYADVAILPGYSRIILDEAHNIEDVATDYFGVQVSKWGLLRLLGRLYSLRERERVREKGLIPFLLARLRFLEKKIDVKVHTRIFDHVQSTLIPQRENLAFVINSVFDDFAAFFESVAEDSTAAEVKVRFTPSIRRQPAWQELILTLVQQLLRELRDYHQQLLRLEKLLETLPEEVADSLVAQTVELNALTDRIEAAAKTLGEIFDCEDANKVSWVESRASKAGKRITLKQAPLDISELLRDRIFQKFPTVVMTSATLTTEGQFNYLKGRLGLDEMPSTRLLELVLPPPFDYSQQVVLGVPKDIPLPDHPTFRRELSKLIFKSVSISEGRALVLFTSYSLLRHTHEELQEPLQALGIRCLKQGDAPRHRLTEIFKDDKASVLFATDSFWEGVDVAGEALENVILTKLPFSVPKEPVIEARIEAIAQRGGNPFLEYTVPQAVIKFKQGFGRLIRSKTDRGSIMIFDRRILEKHYGKMFLRSLPECQWVSGKQDEVFEIVRKFFQRYRRESRSIPVASTTKDGNETISP
jgi:ATP-dependent DNA helicase DinG